MSSNIPTNPTQSDDLAASMYMDITYNSSHYYDVLVRSMDMLTSDSV